MRSSGLLLLALALASGCSRPVVGRDGGDVVIIDIDVAPAFIRAGALVRVLFRVAGPTPSDIRGELAGQPLECSDQRRADGRFECVLASVDPSAVRQGSAEALVTVVDADGRASVAQ
ncbi:MAG: hypothetical protein AAFV29_20845, partial [Myxococcota bacterium]